VAFDEHGRARENLIAPHAELERVQTRRRRLLLLLLLVGGECVRQHGHIALGGRCQQTAGNEMALQIIESANGAERSHANV
jgi:hypothetical protein